MTAERGVPEEDNQGCVKAEEKFLRERKARKQKNSVKKFLTTDDQSHSADDRRPREKSFCRAEHKHKLGKRNKC